MRGAYQLPSRLAICVSEAYAGAKAKVGQMMERSAGSATAAAPATDGPGSPTAAADEVREQHGEHLSQGGLSDAIRTASKTGMEKMSSMYDEMQRAGEKALTAVKEAAGKVGVTKGRS